MNLQLRFLEIVRDFTDPRDAIREAISNAMDWGAREIKVIVTEALGHASVAFTMDTYSHIIEGMQEDAMALLDEVLPAGVFQKVTPI